MESIFFDITVIIFIAALLSILFRILKQPAILAYIFTGIILGSFGIYQLQSTQELHTLGQVGIMLVLFMLGLELRLKELRSIGPIAILAGGSQILLTGGLSFGVALLLGFPQIASLYIAMAMTFSSTIVVVKLLSDRKNLNSLYGKISVGMLLVQDFVAVFTLVILSGFQTDNSLTLVSLLFLIGKAGILVLWIYALSKTVLPFALKYAAKSGETLFLFALAWVFVVAFMVSAAPFNFTIEMGGFLAGLALSNFAQNFQIIGKVRALRDFFVTIFFVLLGVDMTFGKVSEIVIPTLIFVVLILVLKPLVIAGILGLLGYKKRTSFFVGVHLGQISEFGLIVLYIGNSLGHIDSPVISMVTTVALFSFAGSTMLILHANKVYKKIENSWLLFEKKNTIREHHGDLGELSDHIVIIGGDQMGQSILHSLQKTKEKAIVVDFDPDIVQKLKDNKIMHVFGDISDLDIQERSQIEKAKLVISTVPDMEDNLLLIEKLNHENRKAKIIVVAYNKEDAKTLYKKGADYVVLPHLAGGMHLAKIITEKNLDHVKDFKHKDFIELL